MPIDDNPIDALRKQFEMEELSTSPITARVVQIAKRMPLPDPLKIGVDFLANHLESESVEKIRILLETVADEAVKHGKELQRLSENATKQEERTRPEVMAELLADAARKAQNTRAKERVQRIAFILCNALVEPKAADADEVEEMMRVAMELSDRDILFLRELIRIEGHLLSGRNHLPRYDAHTFWTSGFWGDRVMPELDSVFNKLESYGLVARISAPNNINSMGDYQNRFVLLPKGLRYAERFKSDA